MFEAAKLIPEKIADYYPPIRSGAVKPDMNANLWILPTTSAQSKSGELIYDVVNNRGEMMYRVRIPAGRSVAGFGKDGEVYLMYREAKGWTLERTSLRISSDYLVSLAAFAYHRKLAWVGDCSTD